jgi:serine racemase
LDVIIAPISGGGMISGIAVAAKALKPSIRVVAAEPRGANDAADAAASKRAGARVSTMPKPKTIADGLQAKLGDLTWPIVRDLVDEVIVISDQEIVAAMKLIFERMKVVVEPSGAAGLAAALSPDFAASPSLASAKSVGVVLCGGNLDFGARGFWDGWGV